MNSCDIAYRTPTAGDTAFALETHHLAYHDVAVKQFGPWDTKAQDAFFSDFWGSPDQRIILYNSVPCGYFEVQELPDAIMIKHLTIHPKFQNKGVGTHLLNTLKDKALKSNKPLKLQVLLKNRAINLYRKVGFVVVDEDDKSYDMEWRPARYSK